MIFDFNGTLVDDSVFHDMAWNSISIELRGKPFTVEELRTEIYGMNNSSIVNYLSGQASSAEILSGMAEKKERIYRELCLADPGKFKLVPGAEAFLDFLKVHDIPRAIATASGPDNVDFYVERLGLDRWFPSGKIVFDDSTFRGKPAPDFYLIASGRLNLAPGECVVFEDSASGLKSADNAGIGMIVAVKNGKEPGFKSHSLRIDLSIEDFTGIDAGGLFQSGDIVKCRS